MKALTVASLVCHRCSNEWDWNSSILRLVDMLHQTKALRIEIPGMFDCSIAVRGYHMHQRWPDSIREFCNDMKC